MPTLSLTLVVLKEIIVSLFLLSLIPLIKKNKYITDSSIIGKLKILFVCGLSIPLIFFIFGIIFPEGRDDYTKGLVENPALNFIISGSLSLLIGALCILIILMLYELVMFNRKRLFVTNFKILIFFSIIYVLWTNFKGFSSGQIPKDILGTGALPLSTGNVIDIIVVLLIIFISLKSSWVASGRDFRASDKAIPPNSNSRPCVMRSAPWRAKAWAISWPITTARPASFCATGSSPV